MSPSPICKKEKTVPSPARMDSACRAPSVLYNTLHGHKGSGSVRAGTSPIKTLICTVYFMGLVGDKQSRAGS